ncbi:MAG: hypothetical protein ACI8TQ_001003 [Planctomycetota bacterium]|jgi:hypothetical protein
MNPATNKSGRSQFEIEVELDMQAWTKLRHGMTGRVRIVGDTETMAKVWYRKVITLVNRLSN